MNKAVIPLWSLFTLALIVALTGCTPAGKPLDQNAGQPAVATEPAAQPGLNFSAIFGQRVSVHGDCMEPTLKEGQVVGVQAVKAADLKRGDVVFFDQGGTKMVRRLVGLPGETVAIHEGVVYVDDQPQDETYSAGAEGTTFDAVTLAEGQYFVLCDNRANTNDSRAFGTILAPAITGRLDLK